MTLKFESWELVDVEVLVLWVGLLFIGIRLSCVYS